MLINNINKRRRLHRLPPLVIEKKIPETPLIPITLTPRQQELAEITKNLTEWALVGGIGSGKTTLNCILFLERVKRCTDKNAVFGLAGTTHGAVMDVLVSAIENRLGFRKGYITINPLTKSFKLFDKKIKILSCGSSNDFKRWKGINLSGVWGTNVTKCNEEDLLMLLGSVRLNEAFVILETDF